MNHWIHEEGINSARMELKSRIDKSLNVPWYTIIESNVYWLNADQENQWIDFQKAFGVFSHMNIKIRTIRWTEDCFQMFERKKEKELWVELNMWYALNRSMNTTVCVRFRSWCFFFYCTFVGSSHSIYHFLSENNTVIFSFILICRFPPCLAAHSVWRAKIEHQNF